MSPQENQLLQNFLQQLAQVKLTAKDPEAAALIASASAAQPDAGYLLVQRALLQDQALQAAQQQIAQLQAQLANLNTTQASGFFGNSSAFRSENSSNSGAWGNSSTLAPLATVPVSPSAALNAPAASSFFGGNAGSVLGTVAATAAGVAAGAFLFQGLGSLMGSGHQPAGAASAAPVANDSGLIPNSFADDSSAATQLESTDTMDAIDSAGDLGDFSEV